MQMKEPLNPVEYEVRGHGQKPQNAEVRFQINILRPETLFKRRIYLRRKGNIF